YRPQMQPANILTYYRTVADRSPIPVLIYSVPIFTNYDMPTELVIELADHRNIVGIKESGGDAAKIREIVEGTRHVKRSATVTETFAAMTPRMLKAAEQQSSTNIEELVPVAALAGATTGHVGTEPALSDRPTGGSRMGAPNRPVERRSTQQTPSSAI